MNTAEYIGSGNLEAYALGALSAKEANEVLAAASMYPEVAKEIREIEAVMRQFTTWLAIQPPAGTEERILGGL